MPGLQETLLTWPVVSGVATVSTVIVSSYIIYRRHHRNVAIKQVVKNPPFWAKKCLPKKSTEELAALEERKPHKVWNTVLFFPDLIPCRPDSPTKQLHYFFKHAKTSIYLCMYLCSNWQMADIIQRKHKDGLIIYLVTDFDTWTAHNSRGFHALEQAGVQVRLNKNGYLMHNKFAIIDEEVVVTGSLNWTNQGIRHNNENVLVTTDPRITKKYLEEFNKIYWACQDIEDFPDQKFLMRMRKQTSQRKYA